MRKNKSLTGSPTTHSVNFYAKVLTGYSRRLPNIQRLANRVVAELVQLEISFVGINVASNPPPRDGLWWNTSSCTRGQLLIEFRSSRGSISY